jgi:hypothetical protein
MASVNVTVNESGLASSGTPASSGTLFIAGITDEAPSGAYVLCGSLQDYVNNFGPRSTTSALVYDSLDLAFRNGLAEAYVARVTDNTATKASLTLQDSGPHPTVTVTAASSGIDGNALEVAVLVSSGQFTVEIEDTSGDVLESHGPYTTQAQLLADTTSTLVTFAQATGTGFTSNPPAALTATTLSGGANASDITDASHVAALANFPATLGPGTVILPGRTTAAIAQGLAAHAVAFNRWAVIDQADATTSAAAIAAKTALSIPAASTKACFAIQGSVVIPPVSSGANRTVPGSAAVAARRAYVAGKGNDAQAAAGVTWGALSGVVGFTTAADAGGTNVSWSAGDVAALTAAGINHFSTKAGGTNCLDEFVSLATSDPLFFQATQWTEVMALVGDFQELGELYKFRPLISSTFTDLHGDLAAIVQQHFLAGALDGDSADDAASIDTLTVNTSTTIQAGQLNASVNVHISPYAETINIRLNVLELVEPVGPSE